jgi:hypothetical protein
MILFLSIELKIGLSLDTARVMSVLLTFNVFSVFIVFLETQTLF